MDYTKPQVTIYKNHQKVYDTLNYLEHPVIKAYFTTQEYIAYTISEKEAFLVVKDTFLILEEIYK